MKSIPMILVEELLLGSRLLLEMDVATALYSLCWNMVCFTRSLRNCSFVRNAQVDN